MRDEVQGDNGSAKESEDPNRGADVTRLVRGPTLAAAVE